MLATARVGISPFSIIIIIIIIIVIIISNSVRFSIFFPLCLLQKFYIVFCPSYESIGKKPRKTIVLSSGPFLQVFTVTIQ